MRGLLVGDGFRKISQESTTAQAPLSDDLLQKADVLGWCIELYQGFFLVLDDVMDQSETRRGQPCWYKLPHINLDAVNDGILIESCIPILLRKHFGSNPELLISLTDLFEEMKLTTEIGQLLDLTQTSGDRVNLSHFTLENYRRIVKYKTSYYSFYLPVACALQLAKVNDQTVLKSAEEICLDFGEFFQIQDDYLDCFGDVEQTGKIGTDIQDMKCSWLAIQFIQNATSEQLSHFETHYGRKDEGSVEIIKKLYSDVNLASIFKNYENDTFEKLSSKISKVSLPGLRDVFVELVHWLFKREK